MRPLLINPIPSLKGKINLAGDKSIAHRAVILSAISRGNTVIKNFPLNQDCLYTLNAFRRLGVRILSLLGRKSDTLVVSGSGLHGLRKPPGPLFVGDSGTTLRLLTGLLAGQDFKAMLKTGSSLAKRPMLRVTLPLRMMGAKIEAGRRKMGGRPQEYPPITIKPGKLQGINYKTPVASAQVKSAILLAGLYAKGETRVIESLKTRDHTERMLSAFRAKIKMKKNTITIKGGEELVSPKSIHIPGDISSASFFIVLGSIVPCANIRINNVGLNPTRTGVLTVLKRMGAKIEIVKPRVTGAEPQGDLLVRGSFLKATTVKKKEIPGLIDELPVLMVAACYASGKSIFEGVEELRVKETDRISSMSLNLRKMGADIKVIKKGKSEKVIIKGAKKLIGCSVRSFQDHRTAMSLVVAGLKAEGQTRIDDISCINKSFPNFLTLLKTLS